MFHLNGRTATHQFVVHRNHAKDGLVTIRSPRHAGWFFRHRRVGIFVLVIFIFVGEERLPIAKGQKMLLVVFPWILSRIDVKEPVLACISPAMQVGAGHGVRVIPA